MSNSGVYKQYTGLINKTKLTNGASAGLVAYFAGSFAATHSIEEPCPFTDDFLKSRWMEGYSARCKEFTPARSKMKIKTSTTYIAKSILDD